MHAKMKGNIGAFALGLFLAKHNYSVFTEEGDLSKTDVIAEKGGKLIKFQAKAITPVDNKIHVSTRKCGPNYVYRYTVDDFDYMAVYDLENEKLYIIDSKTILERINSFSINLDENTIQQKNVNKAEDYLASKWSEIN